ncbi:MAG: hypothetical protein KAJ18_08570 [Candidatus Omnitrophica bacterium]|nr:hypothetical protein [Candidatus Omnitrophota bacterium]
MKKQSFIILALFLFFILNPQTTVEARWRSSKKPKHVIFLIHGIAGNKTHFGYMAKALARTLNKKDPSRRYIVRSIEYDTGNNDKTPYDFAKDVDLQIKRITASAKFKKDDKISLIMHSQGGLIGSIWVFQSLMNTPGYSTPETIAHLDSFITLGTPFWGAKTAQWGSEIKNLTSQIGVDIPLPFGKNELEQMAFGSDTIFDFRMAMIDPQYQKHIDYLKQNVKFLNVVGVANLLNPLGIFVSGTGQYEDDGAVPLASARFNFLYTQSIKSKYSSGDVTTLEKIKKIDIAPYVIVNAMHRSPLPELENFAGIAQIPEDCIKNESCRHPAFSYLWNTLLGNPVQQLDDNLGDFKTFLLDINIRVASENKYSCKDLKVEFFKLDGSPLNNSNIEISKFFELYSHGKNDSKKYPNHCRFYAMGSIKKTLESRTEAVLIKISGENLKTRFIEMQVKEGYSSFVDINLLSQVGRKDKGGARNEKK